MCKNRANSLSQSYNKVRGISVEQAAPCRSVAKRGNSAADWAHDEAGLCQYVDNMRIIS